MKEKRSFVPMLALTAVFVVALLLLAGTYAVIASQVSSAGPDLIGIGNDDSAPFWSRWVTITAGTCPSFTHGLNGDPNNYAVELLFLDTEDGWGLNRRYYGGLEFNGHWYGVHWQDLTANTIRVCRHQDDNAADRIRIRVWDPPDDPDYASPWTDIAPLETLTFTHGLGITATDLTVSLWFSSTGRGIHNFGYGGLAVDPPPGSPPSPGRMLGAHWHHLTDNTVQVTRHPHDTDIVQVRVVVVHGTSPDYDSLEALGDWQSINKGEVYTFTHGLSWDTDMLLVRGECYYESAFGGIHQWLAGGNHDGLFHWQGTNLQNVTTNTIQVYRQLDDAVCPQARVRIWRRSIQTFLPVVLSNHEP